MAQAFKFSNTFQSTPSAWRETYKYPKYTVFAIFQSTPSAWRETISCTSISSLSGSFQSTPSAWRETGRTHAREAFHTDISIHSLRMEGDRFRSYPPMPAQSISIHSLRMEGDRLPCTFHPPASQFQSTPSAWRETPHRKSPPDIQLISIHSLRMEGDQRQKEIQKNQLEFQSTPSAWRETAKLHRKAFFISPILVQSCKKGCKRLHSAPEKMVFFEKREKNLVRNLQHLSVRL